ncbi:DMT family transporter [Pasteurella bettyae]|uniref:DMT family transporter n=1 Tax=Pasteurella bettyae TaxID=752 RepID=UPI003D290B3C
MQKYLGELILFCVSLLAALGWFFSKYSLVGFPSVGFIAVRFLAAFVIFLPFAYAQIRTLEKRQFIISSLLGTLFATYFLVLILAITHNTNFGAGAFIVSLAMLIAPLIAWIIFHNKAARSFAIALPFAFIGLYFIAKGNSELQFSSDDWLYLLTAILEAIYFVLNNHYAKHIPTLSFTTIQFGAGGLVCAIYSCLLESWTEQIPLESIYWLVLSVLVATNFRFLLQTLGQKLCNISNAALIMLLEPVWTLILSAVIFSEILSWQKILGCSLILLSLILYRLPNVLNKAKVR